MLLAYAARVQNLIDSSTAFAAVPLAWHGEVAGQLLKKYRAKVLTDGAFDTAARYYEAMPLSTYANAYTLQTLLGVARRYNLQALDAIYFDIARNQKLPLATWDRGLKTAATRYGVALFMP